MGLFNDVVNAVTGGGGSGSGGGGGVLGAHAGGVGLFQTGLAIKNLIDPENNNDIKRAQQSSQKQSDFLSELQKAIADPTHPWYKQLVSGEMEAGHRAYLDARQRGEVWERRRNELNTVRSTSIHPDFRDATNELDLRNFAWQNADRARQNARSVLAAAGGIPGITNANTAAGDFANQIENRGDSERDANISIIGEGLNTFSESLPAFEQLFGSSSAPTIRVGGTSGGAGRGAGPGGGTLI